MSRFDYGSAGNEPLLSHVALLDVCVSCESRCEGVVVCRMVQTSTHELDLMIFGHGSRLDC